MQLLSNTLFQLIFTGLLLMSCSGKDTQSSQVKQGVSGQTEQQKPAPQRYDSLTIAMTGDIMMGTLFPSTKLAQNDGRDIFADVTPVLSGANVAVGNLEGAMADEGQPNELKMSKLRSGAGNVFAFRMPTRYAQYLKDAGFDFVSMANNHSYDFGAAGQNATRKALDAVQVGYAGNPGHEMMVKEIDGVRYGYCAFGYNRLTVHMTDEAEVKRIITQLRDSADVVIVSFHGGGEGGAFRHVPNGVETQYGENRGNLRRFSHLCIDCGADVVYGHGPHVVRGVELYKGHFIAYSLGNFATPVGISVAGITGYAPVITVTIGPDGKFRSGKIHSFIQRVGVGPRTDASNRVAQEIKGLSEADFPQSPLMISNTGGISLKRQQ